MARIGPPGGPKVDVRLVRIWRLIRSAERELGAVINQLQRYGDNMEHIARSGRADTLAQQLLQIEKYAKRAREQLRGAEKEYR